MSWVSSSEVGFLFSASILPFSPSLHLSFVSWDCHSTQRSKNVLLRSDPLVGLNIPWKVFPLIGQAFGLLCLFGFGSVSSLLGLTFPIPFSLSLRGACSCLGAAIGSQLSRNRLVKIRMPVSTSSGQCFPWWTSLRLVVLVCSLVLSPRSSN